MRSQKAARIGRPWLMRPWPTNRDGNSLMATMVAVFVAAMLTVAFASCFMISARAADKAEKRTVATQAAQAKLEELRTLGYDGAQDQQFAVEGLQDGLGAAYVTLEGSGVKRLDVHITWTDLDGPQSLDLSAFLAPTP